MPERNESSAASPRLCAGCNRPFEVGDRYIVDSSSGFTKNDADPVIDDLIAGIFGGSDSKLWICEDCTEPGEGYRPETYYGEWIEVALVVGIFLCVVALYLGASSRG